MARADEAATWGRVMRATVALATCGVISERQVDAVMALDDEAEWLTMPELDEIVARVNPLLARVGLPLIGDTVS